MTYGSFDYTSLLYLSDYLDDFGGGRFVFVEEGANKTVEPRAGRTSRGGPLPSVTAATAQRSPEPPGPPARQGHPELPCECVPSPLACVGKDSQRPPGEPGHLAPGPRHAVPCCHVSPVVWHRLWSPVRPVRLPTWVGSVFCWPRDCPHWTVWWTLDRAGGSTLLPGEAVKGTEGSLDIKGVRRRLSSSGFDLPALWVGAGRGAALGSAGRRGLQTPCSSSS